MQKRYVAFSVVFFMMAIANLLSQVNNPVNRIKVIQGTSVSNISLFSLNSISTVDAFSENMSGEGFNRDADNGNLYHLRYDADSDFEGIDIAVFETSEFLFGPKSYVTVEIEVVKSIIEANDDFGITSTSENLIVDLVSNDSHSEQDIVLNRIEASNGGSFITLDQSSIEFIPDSNFEGLASATYVVTDELGTSSSADIFIQVTSGKSTGAQDLSYLHVVSDPLLINIDNDGFALSPDADLLFGDLIQVGPVSFLYEATLFTEGIESFVLVNDNGDTKNIEITLVKTIDNQSVLKNDVAYTVPGKYVVIDALANDYRNNGVVVDYSDGLLYASGIFAYIPDNQFEGVKEFYYTINDGFKSHTASIHVYVGNYLPRVIDYTFQVYKNTPLALEYNVPITAFEFSVIDEPSSGTIEVNSSQVTTLCLVASGDQMVVYTPQEGFLGTDQFVIEYCSDAGACERVNVSVSVIENSDECDCVGPDCVWPGDTNRDGVVNVGDLLPIGLYYGQAGQERSDNGDWGAQNSDNWTQEQLNGVNVNHVDANGDGIISISDTTAIIESYGNQDNLIADPTILDKSIPIRLVPSNANPNNGDLLSIDIYVGSEEYPVVDLHGVALSIQIPNQFLSDSTTYEFIPNREWFGSNSPIVPLSFSQGSNVDIGVIRTDDTGISGNGKIGTVNTVVGIDIDQLRPDVPEIPIKIKAPQSYMMDGRGRPVLINGSELVINLQLANNNQTLSHIITDDIDVLFTPNPSYGPITIHANNNDELREVVVYDLMGQKIIEKSNLKSQQTVLTQPLSQGLYIAHVKTQKGFTVQQLEVVR